MEEVWKDVIGYEGYYQVSNLGNVKSLGNEKTKKEKILKTGLSTSGYYQVGLQVNGDRKTYKVHTLVAMSFLGHIPNGTHEVVVDHINSVRTDNNLNNLRLVSSRFNSSRRDRKSNHVGVAYCDFHKKYTAKIFHKGRSKTLGYYDTEQEAIESYNNILNLITTKEDFELQYKDKTSDYRGVSFDKTRNKWVAQTKINYKKYFIGRFNTEVEANNAYLKFIEMNKTQEEPKICKCGSTWFNVTTPDSPYCFHCGTPVSKEPKQETLEEAAEKYAKGKSSSSVFQEAHKRDFIEGANYQTEIMDSRQDLIDFVHFINGRHFNQFTIATDEVDLFIEQRNNK